MSCNLTAKRLEVQKVRKIYLSTKNKPDVSILFETGIAIILLIFIKNSATN